MTRSDLVRILARKSKIELVRAELIVEAVFQGPFPATNLAKNPRSTQGTCAIAELPRLDAKTVDEVIRRLQH